MKNVDRGSKVDTSIFAELAVVVFLVLDYFNNWCSMPKNVKGAGKRKSKTQGAFLKKIKATRKLQKAYKK